MMFLLILNGEECEKNLKLGTRLMQRMILDMVLALTPTGLFLEQGMNTTNSKLNQIMQ